MTRPLIALGIIILIIAGLAWPLIQKWGLGHLPGDILIKKANFTFYFPLITCILISIMGTSRNSVQRHSRESGNDGN